MKDTPPVLERKFRQMLMKRSGEERLKMGCSMHATGQVLAKASISQQHPGARPAELKRLLFLHFYGADFGPKERKRIASALAKKPQISRSAGARQASNAQTITPKNAGHREGFGAGAVRENGETYEAKGQTKAKRSRSSSR